jgi:hypothetical protein
MYNIYNISRITYQEAVRNPLFYIVIAVSAVLLLISPLFCLFAFGEEVSMMREVGLATITFTGLLISILTASFVITNEIENLTAIMLLAKPVRRCEFIIGKFMGIVFTVLIAFLFLTFVFIVSYWLKEGLPSIQEKIKEGLYLKGSSITKDTFIFFKDDIWILLKGIYSCFLQVVILTSFAVAFSSFFPLVLSGLGCFVLLIFGNISDYISNALNQKSHVIFNILSWVSSSIIPQFSILNTSSLVTTKSVFSINYLFLISFYTIIYVSFVLYLTTVIFSRREIS